MKRISGKPFSLGKIVAGAAPKSLIFGALAAVPLVAAGGSQATVLVPATPQYYLFQVQNATGGSQSALSVALSGDVTSGLGDYVNSFASPSASSSYSNSTNTTTLTFTSIANPQGAIANGAAGTFGFVDNAEPVNFPIPTAGTVESAYWSSGTGTSPVPVADMYQNQVPLSSPIHISDPYAVWTIDVAFASDPSVVTTEYYQTAYNTYPPYLLISNVSGATEIISNAGYYAPSTLTSPLTLSQMEALPSSDFTAPFSDSTPFSQLTYTIDSGSSLQLLGYPAVYAPEAASMAMFGVGTLALLFLPRRRSS